MTKTTRIYLVEMNLDDKVERPPRLIRAGNRAQAERHVARSCITARVATQEDLVEYLGGGIETAGVEDPDDRDGV